MADIPIVVPDVNVIVSGTIAASTPPHQIMEAWRDKRVYIATSPPILEDLRRVLHYPKVKMFTGMTDKQMRLFVEYLRQGAFVVPGTTSMNVSPDPTDNKLFSCAWEAKADYIISGDKGHVLSTAEYRGIKTISPRGFIDTVLNKEQVA